MRKVGIMGGTFNPVHNSHIMLAECAYSALNLDEIWFMPSKHPPHKSNADIVSDEHRLNMLGLVAAKRDYFKVSDIELCREGITYTSDTLAILNAKYPDIRFYFIMGGDSLKSFCKWHNPNEILHRSAIVCSGRGAYGIKELTKDIKHVINQYQGSSFIPEIHSLSFNPNDISSNDIRTRVKCHQSIYEMVPDSVADYIIDNQLYKSELIDTITKDLQTLLKPSRYSHVIGVANMSFMLAECHSVDAYKAYLAGLLHDCTKYMSDAEQLTTAARFGIKTSALEKKLAGNLLHSKTGAMVAKEKYGVNDKDILSAIYYHTTGHPRMTKLEMIINISDTLEPGRTMDFMPSLDVIRGISTFNLELALYLCTRNIVDYLLSTNSDNVCHTSIRTLKYYEKKLGINNT